jgi:hypothetical protein
MQYQAHSIKHYTNELTDKRFYIEQNTRRKSLREESELLKFTLKVALLSLIAFLKLLLQRLQTAC